MNLCKLAPASFKKWVVISTFSLILLTVISYIFSPARFLLLLNVQINNVQRFDGVVHNTLLLFFALLAILFINQYISNGLRQKVNDTLNLFLNSLSRALSFNSLLIISSIYLFVLFVIGIKNYDIGTDEVWYILGGRSLFKFFFPYYTTNGLIYSGSNFYLADNLTSLPTHIASFLNYAFNFTEVWQFKFTATLLSCITIITVFYTIYKIYDIKYSTLFLFLVIIQPGFGFMATSFFGEIPQLFFFFAAVYFWFKEDKEFPDKKEILLISLFFALLGHTKLQTFPILILSLILFHFIDKGKKPVQVAITTIALFIFIAIIRTIPIFLFDQSLLIKIAKFYFLSFTAIGNESIVRLQRLQLYNHYLSILFFALTLSISFFLIRKPIEKFIYLFTLIYTLWFILFFDLNTYRNIFLGIFLIMFLASVSLLKAKDIYFSNLKSTNNLRKFVIAFFVILLMIWGFSANLIYAIIGYNDGVQFDLEGSKTRLFTIIRCDDSQKTFYKKIKNYISPNDTVYICGSGIPVFTTQFYLPDNPIYDFNHFKESLVIENRKLIIIDRVSYPIDLEVGRKVLDSLNLNKTLILKTG